NLAYSSIMYNLNLSNTDFDLCSKIIDHDYKEFRFDFVGCLKLDSLKFYFLVKLGVVDRDGDLTHERVEKLNLLFVKLVAVSCVETENPQRLPLNDQWHSHIRHQTLGQIKVRSFQTRVEL